MSQLTTQNNVFINPEPFTPRVEKLNVAPGRRVVDILIEACNNQQLALDDIDRLAIYVNGEQLPEEGALDYVTEVGDIINVAVIPLGGGGGDGNKVLQTVMTLAVIAVSFWVGGPAGPLAALGTGIKGTLIRAAAAAAVQIGGSLAINAMFRPDRDELAPANDKKTLQDQQNQYRPRANMPLVLGQRRVAFDLAAKPYTQLINDDSWLYVAFGLHYGECQVTDIKIGETLLSTYPADEIELEYFLTPGPRNSQIYPGRVIQENLQDELDIGGDFEVHTSSTNPDRLEIDLTWPAGLRYNKDNGKILPQETQLLVEWSVAGANFWQPAPTPSAVDRLGNPLPPGSVYVQAKTNDPVRRTIGWATNSKQQFDVRVRAWDPDGDDPDTVVQSVYWTALRTIEYTPPIVDENLAVIFMRIKASDDLNGTLPVLTGVVTPIIPVWDGSGWTTKAASSNAAALVRWLLTGPATTVPLDPDAHIHSSISTAYELIEEYDWHGSIYSTSESSQEDIINALGRMGRFSTYWNGSKLCFVTDWEKPAARQLFSGLNAQGYRYKRSFPSDIHAVLVEYVNSDEDWQSDEMWVYNDGYDANSANIFETLRLDYSCSMDKAYRDGRVYLAKRKLQVEMHEWTAGADAIVSTYGDRVRVRHNTTLYGLGEATVQFRKLSGGLVSGLRLDNAIEMVAGRQYSIDARAGDYVVTGVQIVNNPGIHRDVVFAVPMAVADAPAKGDLVVFGEIDQVTEDLEIIEFEPQADQTVAIRAQKYAAEAIMAAETGPIPELNTGITPRNEAPIPRIIRAEGSPEGVRVTFDIDPQRKDQIAGFMFRYRLSADSDSVAGPWVMLNNLPATARQAITPPFPDAAVPPEDSDTDGQYRIDVELRTIMRTDKYSRPATASGILVSKFVQKPIAFNATGDVRTAPDGSKYPVIYIECQPVIGGGIQDLIVEIKLVGDSVANYKSAGQSFPASNPFGDITGVQSGQSYSVRARWRTFDNWRSDWVVDNSVLVPEGSYVAGDTVLVGGKTPDEWAQEIADMVDIGDIVLEDFDRVKEAVEFNAQSIWALATRLGENKDRLEEMVNIDGKPIGTILTQEIEQRVTADEAYLAIFNVMGAWRDETHTAWILNAQTVYAAPDQSFAEYFQAQTTRFEDNEATIQTVSTTLSNEIGAVASELHVLGAQTPDGSAFVIRDDIAKVLSTGESLAQQRTGVTAEIGAMKATAVTESKAYVDNNSAFAQVLQTLGVSAAGFSGKITQFSVVDSQLGAKYGVALNVNGHITGFIANNNGVSGSFVIVASQFAVISPSGTGYIQPFAISGGVCYMDEVVVNKLRANTIVATHIQANNIVQSYYGVDNSAVVLSNGSPVTVASVGVNIPATSAGNAARVTFKGLVRISNTGGITTCHISFQRNGSELDSYIEFCDGAWGDNFHYYELSDSPPTGNHTYGIVATRNSSGGGPITKTRARATIEVRKTEN